MSFSKYLRSLPLETIIYSQKHLEMYDVYTDKDFQEELLKGLKQRVLDQKFLYTQEGAQIYYELTDQKYKEKEEYTGRFMDKSIRKFIPTDNRPSLLSNQHFLTDFIKTHSCRDSPCCIISLGCGDARQEALLLTHLSQTLRAKKLFCSRIYPKPKNRPHISQ